MFERIKKIHDTLIERPDYQKYLKAMTDADSVEGSMDADTICAAVILRRAAGEAGDAGIASLRIIYIGEAIEKIIGRPVDLAKRESEERESQAARRAFHEAMGTLPPTPRSPH